MRSERKTHSLGINAILNAINSGLRIIFPLITYPYAFRILHTNGIGKVDYSSSIVNYFVLLAGLGISTYAIREGAKLRTQQQKFRIFSNEVFSLNIVSTLFSYSLLFLLVFVSRQLVSYRSIILVLSLNIAFTTLSIEWVNTIYEDFLYITVRSIVAYILFIGFLFLFVRSEKDILQYAFLTVLQTGVIAVLNLFHCRRYVHLKITRHINFRKHIKPILLIFANNVAITIYVSSDTTMLGIMTSDHYVGLYSLSVRIYNVVKTMLAAVYSAVVPRISYLLEVQDIKSVRNIFTKLFSYMTLILLPAGVGLAMLSREIVLLMGGQEYVESIPTLQILSVSLIGAVYGGLVTYGLNIPLRREKYNFKATIISALINIGLNFIMIPLFHQNGAAVTTAISEFFVFFYSFLSLRNRREFIDYKSWKKNFGEAFLGCVVVVIISVLIKTVIDSSLLRIMCIMGVSICSYGIILVVLKNEFALSIVQKIKQRL